MFNELLKNVMDLGIITDDDVKRLTSIELMMLIIERTNGLLNHVEYIDEKLALLLQNIGTTTVEVLQRWTEDGTFDRLLNQSALKMVNDRIDETNAQLAHAEDELKTVINLMNFQREEGETSDDGRLQRAIDYSVSLLEKNTIGSQRIIEIPSGTYQLNSTITVPIFVKLKSIGAVIFESNIEDGPAFRFYTPETINFDGKFKGGNRFSLFKGNWLNGDDGGISIVNTSGTKNSIAIEIGQRKKVSGFQFFTAWYYMSNVVIFGFGVGIKFNSYNMFLGKIDRFLFTECDKCMTFSGEGYNSGESMSFNDCIYGDSNIVCDVEFNDLELNFIGCSFDFINKAIETSYNGVYRFTNCHFEGIGFTNNKEPKGDSFNSIIHSKGSHWTAPNIMIIGCDFMSTSGVLFKADKKNGMNLFINSLTTKGSDGYNKNYALCDDNVKVVVNNFYSDKYYQMITQRKLNQKINSGFEKLEIGTAIKDNQQIEGYTFGTGITGKCIITGEEVVFDNTRSLKLTVPSEGLWTQIKSEEFECKGGDRILANMYWFLKTKQTGKFVRNTIKAYFYDKDGNVLPYPSEPMDGGTVMGNSTNNEWNRLMYMEDVVAPKNTAKCVLLYDINATTECELYLSEFFVSIR